MAAVQINTDAKISVHLILLNNTTLISIIVFLAIPVLTLQGFHVRRFEPDQAIRELFDALHYMARYGLALHAVLSDFLPSGSK